MERNQRSWRKTLSKRRKTGWLESYSSESQDDDGYCSGDDQHYSSDDTIGREMDRRYEHRGEQFRRELDEEAERENREIDKEYDGYNFNQSNHQENQDLPFNREGVVEEGGQCGDKDQGLTSGQERGELLTKRRNIS